MENCQNIEAINSQLLFPDEIIQHIQSFLDVKQAVRTSILSKSWYNAWSTRPNLEFDQRYLRDHDPESRTAGGFLELVKNTMQSCHQSNLEPNLKIQSFKLCMTSYECDNYSLTKELILIAIYKMDASNLDLQFPAILRYASPKTFVLPNEVLGSETLISLSLRNCKIDLGTDVKVRCSRLKSLSLCNVYIVGDHIIWDIILRCPLLEKLKIDYCEVLQSFNGVRGLDKILIPGPSTRPYEFKKLKCLWLEEVNIDTLFFSDFSSKFPCLKDLTIEDCYGYDEIKVSSRSLKLISIAHYAGMLKATFDVPSTCVFVFAFDGCFWPCLTFETSSRERVCSIFTDCSMHSASWFIELQIFLTKLRSSRINLHLHIRGSFLENSFDYASDVQGLPKPVVNNLTLLVDAPSPFYSAFLDGIFWTCRPNFITLCFFFESDECRKANCDFAEFLWKTLIQELSENCYIPNRDNLGLKEVNVKSFVKGKWRPLPWKILLKASTIPEDVETLSFQLQWGE